MKIILCEGNEKWFLDEITKRQGKPSRIVEEFTMLQEIIRTLSKGKPIGYPNPKVVIHPINPSKKSKDYLYRLIARSAIHLRGLSEYLRVVKVLVILDENGEKEHVSRFIKVAESEVKKRLHNLSIEVQAMRNSICIIFGGKYVVEYEFFVVPNSYEIQLFKKFKELYKNELKDVNEEDLAINIICSKNFKCDKEKLYRSAVELFKNDDWFNELVELIKS